MKGRNSSTAIFLAEAALLALEQIAQGFEGAVVGAGDGTAAAAIVNQGVHRLLQHALFVADDDVGGVELDEPLEAVVAVDDPAIEVVQVRRGEPAAVQLHHGAQLGRDDGQHVDWMSRLRRLLRLMTRR